MNNWKFFIASFAAALMLGCSAAMAGPTTLLCYPSDTGGVYQDDPTTIILNEAQSSVAVRFPGEHQNFSSGLTGGWDGEGGAFGPGAIGPLQATFTANSITFSNSSSGDYKGDFTLDRPTGAFTFSSADHEPDAWTKWSCQAAKAKS